MNRFIACTFVVFLGACATDESARHDTQTARASADEAHRHDHDAVKGAATDAELRAHDRVKATGVKPVAIATPHSGDAPVARSGDDGHVGHDADHTSDREVTRRIRKALTDDNQLTTAAKNVKIDTKEGHVTLRGNVDNDHDKSTVDSYAREVAGNTHVDNQLVIR
jgi:osmotically-inducible protein OsmY